MGQQPLISVVVPTYNYARFLDESIRSVAEQTYPRMELVVVDDCSTDETPQVLQYLAEQYQDRFENICLLQNETNAGAHASLNRGIRASTASWVSVLNADDMYEPNRLEALHAATDTNGAQLAFSNVLCIDKDGSRVQTDFAKHLEELPARVKGRQFALLGAAAENVAVSTGNLLFARSLFDTVGGFADYKYVHDYNFVLKAMLAGEPAYCDQTAYLYRIHGDNSFMKLAQIGIPENRLVWLDLYEAVKKGRLSNPRILETPSYKEAFRDAVHEYGVQKSTLYALAGTPVGNVVKRLMRAKLGKTQHE